MSKPGPTLALQQASKRFDTLLAVDAFSLQAEPGEIHALVGENGAGKSTALKLMAGALHPSSGGVLVDGSPLNPHTQQQAMRLGVGLVHQHFMLVDAFTALENIMLGHEHCRRWGILDRAAAHSHAEQVAERAGLGMDLSRTAASLSVGERQRLEILRVLVQGARALLLDEPTAVLSPPEVEDLYRMLQSLADEGATIVVVTHRLDEVMRHCHRVTIMRHGRHITSRPLTGKPSQRLRVSLTRAIMGTEIAAPCPPPPPPDDPPALSLRVRLRTSPANDRQTVPLDVTLKLRRGEVVGVAGVEGNGQQALVRCLAGLTNMSEGHIVVGSQTVLRAPTRLSTVSRVARLRAAGLVVVHADRHRNELLADASVADNLVLGDVAALSARRDGEQEAVKRRLSRFEVYPAEPHRLAAQLSGGNQQKLVMARALDRRIAVLVAAQPTRGVDVGTARVIQHALLNCASEGAAVLVVSADLNELRELSHRIVVLRKGTLVAEFTPQASDEDIGRAMLGTEAA